MSKHKNNWLVFVVGMLALGSLACSVALFEAPGGSLSPGDGSAQIAPGLPTPLPDDMIAEADAEELLLINIYQRVNPAVVNIDVSAETGEGLADFGSGSGFIIDPGGYIVTNNHVVFQADEVRVTFSDGVVMVAEVQGYDIYSDLAVLKVDLPLGRTLTAVELGDSDALQVGQRVIAIGNPFGLSGSMTVGIISAVGRTLPGAILTDGSLFSNPLIIQTDAAINPGSSGGPLLDSHGRVIGVSYAIRSQTGVNTGIGFAIPVNTVKRIVPQIIENGEVQYPYLGISAQSDFTLADLANEFDLPVTEGVLIAEVMPNTAASRAGLRGGDHEAQFRGGSVTLGGDIIVAIDGVPIHSFDELLGYLVSNTSVGQEIIVTIVRGSETHDIQVTLGARPNN